MERLKGEVRRRSFVLCVESYPECFERDIKRELRKRLTPSAVFRASDCYLAEVEIKRLCEPELGDDPIFGRMSRYKIGDFLDQSQLAKMRE